MIGLDYFGDVLSVCFDIWVLGSKMAIVLYHTGHVVTVVCLICRWWDLI